MYRNYTPQEITALAAALQTFVKRLRGEKVSKKRAAEFIQRALEEGHRAEELFCPRLLPEEINENTGLSGGPAGELNLAQSDNFQALAEAVHDYYTALTGRGGQWATASALENLMRSINDNSLETILSAEVIQMLEEKYKARKGEDASLSFFGYIESTIRDLWKMRSEQKTGQPATSQADQEPADDGTDKGDPNEEEFVENDDEVNPFEDPDLIPSEGMEDVTFNTDIVVENTPRICKRTAVETILKQYTPSEISSLLPTMKGGKELTFDNIIDNLTNGSFDPSLEDAAARKIHMSLNGDLNPAFVDCVRGVCGMEMDTDTANGYDILRINWDLRSPSVRKFYKLQRLILKEGEGDEDLREAIDDLEKLYLEKE